MITGYHTMHLTVSRPRLELIDTLSPVRPLDACMHVTDRHSLNVNRVSGCKSPVTCPLRLWGLVLGSLLVCEGLYFDCLGIGYLHAVYGVLHTR